MITDPIADYLTRVRNAIAAKHKIVEIPSSNMKKGITEILYQQGYILNYKFEMKEKFEIIKIALKYDPLSKLPAITELTRISKPGLRKYADVDSLPRVMNGLGIAIISTSKGLMTDKDSRKERIGGEVICYVS
jgi:small subunit ribosomal protein S8